MARKKTKKIETTEVKKEKITDLTNENTKELENKVDLSDTSVNVEEIKDKVLIEEKNEVKIKKSEKKEKKEIKKQVNSIIATPTGTIDELELKYFIGERK